MKRYVLAGASSRGLMMYARPLVQQFQASAALVGIYDPNRRRAAYVAAESAGTPVFDQFETMLLTTKPDTVIVTTIDAAHHEYIIAALEAGCDVITEKPMTIDEVKVQAILAAEQRTGRRVTVAFNYRYRPDVTRVKALLRQGVIGQPLSVDFHWMLDTSHGADYFRRWHRGMENSGGLLVHKATHHFDMVNWWLDDEPSMVAAFGALRFYGPTRAERGERCQTCLYARTCEFYTNFADQPDYKPLYFDAEQDDGYVRDSCVFSDAINIYDTMSVTARYVSGALLSYSLNAHSPYEGWSAAINGTEGRLEIADVESGPCVGTQSRPIRIFSRAGELLLDEPPAGGDGHGGGDARLLQRLFGEQVLPDPLHHQAGSRAGAMSVLLGVAANRSIATGQVVAISSLLDGV